MPSPFPSTVIGILRGALHVVETSGLVADQSAALAKLRAAVAEVENELKPFAALEPTSVERDYKTGGELYR
jgi:hypothetical protein